MKKALAIFIIMLLFVPSFTEGGNGMATGVIKKDTRDAKNSSYNNYETGKMTDLVKTSTGIDYTNSAGKRVRWDAKTGEETETSPFSSGYYQDQMKALLEAQRRNQINALESQYNSSLNTLNTQQSGLSDTYYNKRNQAAARSDVGALNFAQFMASKNVSGGAGNLPEIYRNNALQSQIGALDQQEAAENAQFETAKANLSNAKLRDISNIESDLAAQEMQMTINQINADRAAALEQQKIDAANKTTAYNQLQDTKAEYAKNVNQYYPDFQAHINQILGDDDPTNDWQAAIDAAARTRKIQDQEEEKAAQAKVQEAQQKEVVNNALQLFSQLGYLTPEMKSILSQYGLPTDVYTLNKIKSEKSGSSGSSGDSWMYK